MRDPENDKPSKWRYVYDFQNSRIVFEVREAGRLLGDVIVEEKGDGTMTCRLEENDHAGL